MTRVRSQRKFTVDKPLGRICCIHRISHGSYDIYYKEVILGYQNTIKSAKYVLTTLICAALLFPALLTVSQVFVTSLSRT